MIFSGVAIVLTLSVKGVTGLGEMVIGDIKLEPDATFDGVLYYQPLVYFTNGIEPLQLGGICYDNIGKIQATVICNQLGYELIDLRSARATTNSYPIWLRDVKCEDQKLQHILSCDYNATFGYQTIHSPCKNDQYLILVCDQEKQLTTGRYDGHTILCPPDQSNMTTSNSFGLIAMYLTQHEIWRGLNQPNNSNPLGVNEANAICQQLGYTTAVPGSAVTRKAVEAQYTFEHCYNSGPQFHVQREAWMTTNAVQCSGPQTCFGCCYDYPKTLQCEECKSSNDVVLQCTFVPEQAQLSSGKGGAENECAYDKKSCQSTPRMNICTNILSIIVPSVVAGVFIMILILCIALFCICRRYCCARQRQEDEEPLENQDVADGPDDENVQRGEANDEQPPGDENIQLRGVANDEHPPGGEDEHRDE